MKNMKDLMERLAGLGLGDTYWDWDWDGARERRSMFGVGEFVQHDMKHVFASGIFGSALFRCSER